MKYARLFRENEEPILVSAEDVKNGVYSRNEEFVDLNHEFKVQYVKGARNNGGPYFRLYYSREEYKRLFPDGPTRNEILDNMRGYSESQWHKKWKENMSDFCEIEHHIKNESTKKRKRADAFFDETSTCIEFQHSYIALDFEERNEFYKALGIKTIWLYDLPDANACSEDQMHVEILENNARGFFRISEKEGNLEKNFVYIQVKSGVIYRVKKLYRRDSSTDKKSTIRYFEISEKYTEEEFINAIKKNLISEENEAKTLHELWKKEYKLMFVKNIETGDIICVNHNGSGDMYRDYHCGCIKYSYADNKYSYKLNGRKKEYFLSHEDENRPIWILDRYILL